LPEPGQAAVLVPVRKHSVARHWPDSSRGGFFAGEAGQHASIRMLAGGQALQVITHWLVQPRAHTVHPTAKHREVLGRLLLGQALLAT